jgi:hypothetical protein
MRFHFIGTGYAPPPLGREWARPVATAEGVGEFVFEHCYRVPYFDTLHYLQRADAVLAVGSNDPSYSASKIFPYILCRRPLLLVYHRASPVMQFARAVSAGTRFEFEDEAQIDAVAAAILANWFAQPARRTSASFDEHAFEPYLASTLTRRLTTLFDSIVSGVAPLPA